MTRNIALLLLCGLLITAYSDAYKDYENAEADYIIIPKPASLQM